jgi:hypothetical protein
MQFLLAASTYTGSNTSQVFWSTTLGTILSYFLGVIGILVVVFAVVRVIGHVAKGEVGKAVKAIIGSVILAAFLFAPGTLIGNSNSGVIGIGSNIVNAVISTITGITSSGGTTSSTQPTSSGVSPSGGVTVTSNSIPSS